MQQIYKHPKAEIKRILGELLKYGLKENEIICKDIDVQDELVTFEIHQKIRLLFLEHISKAGWPHANVSFSQAEGDLWRITIQNNGTESYYFSRVLFTILKKFEGVSMSQRDQHHEILQRAMHFAIRKTGKNPSDFETSITVKGEKCKVSIRLATGSKYEMGPNNVDMISWQICKHIPQLIREYSS